MQQTIEALFEKDIQLDDRTCSSKTLEQGSKTVACYEQLLCLLGSEGKPQLEEFICRQLTVSCAQEKQAFTEGFRLGARLMLEVLEK